MSDTRKKEIIMAALELAANKGLGNVSMNMIADKVGIKKPSLYNHFASKEELVETMYQFLREEAKKNANVGAIDYTAIFAGKSALEILKMMVGGYFNMNKQEHMLNLSLSGIFRKPAFQGIDLIQRFFFCVILQAVCIGP